MARTPNITGAEFLEGLPLVDGGIFPAYQELVNRLRVDVPVATAELNEALGLAGSPKAIPNPKGYGIAPGVLTDAYINHVAVGGSTQTSWLGLGAMKNISQIVVYSIGDRIETALQLEDAHHRAAIIRGVLWKYRAGCRNDDDVLLWSSLVPTGVSFLPEPFATHAGVACYYQMEQMPDDNFWTPLATD